MDSQNPTKGQKRNGAAAAIAATALLTTFCSATAFATTLTDRGGPARELESPDPPAVTLRASTVDHVAIRSDASTLESGELEAKSDDTAATPLLRLAPRVSSALRDVFDERLPAAVEESLADVPASPLAESEDIKDVAEPAPDNAAPASQPDNEIDLPLLQRRMYRTDI